MSGYAAAIHTFLGVAPSYERPFLAFAGESLCTIAPKASTEYALQRELVTKVIVKLKERTPFAVEGDMLDKEAQKIFAFATHRMQNVKLERMALADALERYKSDYLYRTVIENVEKRNEIKELSAVFEKVLTLESPREKKEASPHRRFLAGFSDQALNDYIAYWSAEGIQHRNPFLPEQPADSPVRALQALPDEQKCQTALGRLLALPQEQQLHSPFRAWVCEEALMRLLGKLLPVDNQIMLDLVRMVEGITIRGHKIGGYAHHGKEHDEARFLRTAGRFRELLKVFVQHLKEDSRHVVACWDANLKQEVSTVESWDASLATCLTHFFTTLHAKAANEPVWEKLGYLFRSLTQNFFQTPGRQVIALFHEYLYRSFDSPAIECQFEDDGAVQVVFSKTLCFLDKKEEKHEDLKRLKKKVLFSVQLTNTLSSSITDLQHWDSAIALDVFGKHCKDARERLLREGFHATEATTPS